MRGLDRMVVSRGLLGESLFVVWLLLLFAIGAYRQLYPGRVVF
jgi:hypothetical protein